MYTILLLSIALLLSLWLARRIRAAMASRMRRAALDAQLDQLSAAFELDYADFERLQRKRAREIRRQRNAAASKRTTSSSANSEAKPESPAKSQPKRTRQKQRPVTLPQPLSPSSYSAPPREFRVSLSDNISSNLIRRQGIFSIGGHLRRITTATTRLLTLFVRPFQQFARTFTTFFIRPKPPAPPENSQHYRAA